MSDSSSGAAWLAAWGAVGTGVVTAGLALVAAWQLRQAQRMRLEESRPFVILDFEFRSVLVHLAVRNISAAVARNVRISFDQPLGSTLSPPTEIDEATIFKEPIPMLAPGRTISILFDSFPARASRQDLPMAYTVTLAYEDVHGRAYDDPPYQLDLGTYAETALAPKGMPDLVTEIKELRTQVGNVARDLHALYLARQSRSTRDQPQ